MAKYHKLPGDDESVSLLAQARDIWHPIIATCAVVILVLVSFVAGQLSISLSRDSLCESFSCIVYHDLGY